MSFSKPDAGGLSQATQYRRLPLMTVVINDTGKTKMRRPDMATWDYKPSPEGEDGEKYMKKNNRFLAEFERYRDKQSRARSTILANLEPTIRLKFEDDLYEMQPGNL